MDIRSFSLALLISALPLFANADGQRVVLERGDFVSAAPVVRHGETLVSVKLSKSGKAKVRKLGLHEVHTDIAGVESDLKLREPIRDDGMEIGPYTAGEAQKIVGTINQK